MLYSDSSRGRNFAKDPAVIRFKDRYFMYYSIGPFIEDKPWNGWIIGIAESMNLEEWTKVGEILPEGEFEENGICAPGAIVLEEKVHLFYQTYGNGMKDAICHSVSKDGINFERDKTNPVFSPVGSWNCGRAIDADVIVKDNKLLLYFATRDPEFKVQMVGVAEADLSSNFNKGCWRQLCDEPILKPELAWEKKCIEAPALCRYGENLIMFYGGGYNNEPQQIGCAVSEDGVKWRRIYKEPILPNGKEGTWNSSESGHPYAFMDADGQVYLFFQGNSDNGKTWCLSKVMIDWIDGKPVVSSRKK